jgi:hypothetical protein
VSVIPAVYKFTLANYSTYFIKFGRCVLYKELYMKFCFIPLQSSLILEKKNSNRISRYNQAQINPGSRYEYGISDFQWRKLHGDRFPEIILMLLDVSYCLLTHHKHRFGHSSNNDCSLISIPQNIELQHIYVLQLSCITSSDLQVKGKRKGKAIPVRGRGGP